LEIDYDHIDSELTPLGTLSLHEYFAQTGEWGYEIRIDGEFLMASHGASGEMVMARLAFERLRPPRSGLNILIGGLGAGHTLRAALDLPGVSRVVVVEIGAKVVEWNRRYFGEVNGWAVEDSRVELQLGDLGALLPRWPKGFDMLLLDVDNGPAWLAAPGNADLYEPAGVMTCQAALREGGVLAVWSPEASPRFRSNLEVVFPEVEEVSVTETLGGEPALRDVVYLGR
jgi:spermidine synthase